MGSYTHLSSEERDQLGLWRTGGRSMDAISRELGRAKSTISRELRRNALPSAGILRFTPTEPIDCAGGVKRSLSETQILVGLSATGLPKDGRPSRSRAG